MLLLTFVDLVQGNWQTAQNNVYGMMKGCGAEEDLLDWTLFFIILTINTISIVVVISSVKLQPPLSLSSFIDIYLKKKQSFNLEKKKMTRRSMRDIAILSK